MTEYSGDDAAKQLSAEIEQLVGSPIEVTDQVLAAAREGGDFGTVIFELCREAAGLLTLCVSLQLGSTPNDVRFPRNQAICVGLLVRMVKLMTSSMKLSSGREHAETVLILNRCISESAINLRFLLLKDDETLYESVVAGSLKPEKEFHDMILTNIAERGGERFEIEEGMLASIRATFESSGIDMKDVDTKGSPWGGTLRNKLKAMDMEDGYVAVQMIPSHHVHGDWVDLVKFHLNERDGLFEPNRDWTKTDGELLSGGATMALWAAEGYLRHFFEPHMIEPLTKRISDLRDRFLRLETARSDWRPRWDSNPQPAD